MTVSLNAMRANLDDVLSEVIDDSLDVADGEGPLIRLAGVDLDDRQRNYRLLKARFEAKLLAMLVEAGLIHETPPDHTQRAVVKDPHLRDSLRSGFDEGREHPEGSQKVGESGTKPETYEQLQLPGMED